ncbi:MAG: MarR family transcriptional regulator [Cryobacterium sp.]|nr:MarR family transcriptional regulator [Cryobacterium sp.]
MEPEREPRSLSERLYDVDSSDPEGRLIDRSGLSADDIRQIGLVMAALGRLREAEDRLSEASLKYMRLNRTDMRALHFLIVAENNGSVVTPGAIASHLRISTASTTKLLDRLERGGHITRGAHPSDRRALAISITAETREAAMQTVGKQQSRRFYAAARLTADEREAVTRFLTDMAGELDITGEEWASGAPEA